MTTPDGILGFAAGMNVQAVLVDFHNHEVDWSTGISITIASLLLGVILGRAAVSAHREVPR